MANRSRSGVGGDDQPPRDFPQVPPPSTPMMDHSFTLQAIMELQKVLSGLETKTDRLIKDVEGQSIKIDGMATKISFVQGALWVIGIMFTVAVAAAGLVFHFLGKG